MVAKTRNLRHRRESSPDSCLTELVTNLSKDKINKTPIINSGKQGKRKGQRKKILLEVGEEEQHISELENKTALSKGIIDRSEVSNSPTTLDYANDRAQIIYSEKQCRRKGQRKKTLLEVGEEEQHTPELENKTALSKGSIDRSEVSNSPTRLDYANDRAQCNTTQSNIDFLETTDCITSENDVVTRAYYAERIRILSVTANEQFVANKYKPALATYLEILHLMEKVKETTSTVKNQPQKIGSYTYRKIGLRNSFETATTAASSFESKTNNWELSSITESLATSKRDDSSRTGKRIALVSLPKSSEKGLDQILSDIVCGSWADDSETFSALESLATSKEDDLSRTDKRSALVSLASSRGSKSVFSGRSSNPSKMGLYEILSDIFFRSGVDDSETHSVLESLATSKDGLSRTQLRSALVSLASSRDSKSVFSHPSTKSSEGGLYGILNNILLGSTTDDGETSSAPESISRSTGDGVLSIQSSRDDELDDDTQSKSIFVDWLSISNHSSCFHLSLFLDYINEKMSPGNKIPVDVTLDNDNNTANSSITPSVFTTLEERENTGWSWFAKTPRG